MKRIFDLVFALIGIVVLSPLLLIIALAVALSSKGPIIYTQVRVGKNHKPFKIYKFRTMPVGAEKLGRLTLGNHDPRVSKVGRFLRCYKLDELPQLFNVLIGTMSFVGPRPEMPYFVNYYNANQLEVLNFKPGITDEASIYFRNEGYVLATQNDPESYFIKELIPKKIDMSLNYNRKRTLVKDVKVIFKTLFPN
jgi:lipopolysaccharide/colanic/teichoic acid biosynthesis glycosyltransferase